MNGFVAQKERRVEFWPYILPTPNTSLEPSCRWAVVFGVSLSLIRKS
jgi:hypothetical protein